MSRRAASTSAFSGVGAVGMIGQAAWVSFIHWRDDGDGFAWILVGKLADLLHRLGVHLSLDLGDVDHLGGRARFRARSLGLLQAAFAASLALEPAGSATSRWSSGTRTRRTSGRTTMSSTTKPKRPMTTISMARMMSSLVNSSAESHPVGSVIGVAGVSAKRRLTTSTWSPRFWSKPIAVRTSDAIWSISS